MLMNPIMRGMREDVMLATRGSRIFPEDCDGPKAGFVRSNLEYDGGPWPL